MKTMRIYIYVLMENVGIQILYHRKYDPIAKENNQQIILIYQIFINTISTISNVETFVPTSNILEFYFLSLRTTGGTFFRPLNSL